MRFVEKLVRSKFVAVTLIVLPGLWPFWQFYVAHDPTVSADPLKVLLHHLGFVACILLALVLSFTPLRVLFPKSGVVAALNKHRRLVGDSAFFYAGLHFFSHIQYEGGFGVISVTLKNALSKPFQLTGLVMLTILTLLAVTSPHFVARRMGGRNWKRLHRLAYVAAALAIYHQAAARKLFPIQVVWIFGPLLILQILRIIKQRKNKLSRPPAVRPLANA